MWFVSSDFGRVLQISEDIVFLVFDELKDDVFELIFFVNGLMELMIKLVKLIGFYIKNVVYCGCVFVEWSFVVFECNNFVDCRCEEGVFGFSEVEVLVFGMEGFCKFGGQRLFWLWM